MFFKMFFFIKVKKTCFYVFYLQINVFIIYGRKTLICDIVLANT